MAIKNVALIGANGNLGAEILAALAAVDDFRVTIVKRESSTSAIPDSLASKGISVATVDDSLSLSSLKTAFAGQDAVVTAMPLKDPAQHLRIADAAAASGVRRVIPADYGSCDSDSPRAQELVPLFKNKADVRARLQEHAAADPAFSWTSLVCGHFFDWGLRENFLHFDLKGKTADIIDDGSYKSSTATLGRVAEAVVRVLRGDVEETRNKVLFLQSFCVSQNEVLESLEKATGEKWKVNYCESERYLREHKAKADAGDKQAVEDLVFALGALDGNWEGRENFAMGLLGLENEDMNEVVRRVVDESRV
ncbi:NmrA-like family protein [Xylariaceae sp. FL1272]|nr:NmrA-like family protein [Xylariaceae sp. FL1272]